MGRRGVEDEILKAIRRIIRAVDLHSRVLAQTHGLTGPQALILKELSRLEDISIGQLAQHVPLLPVHPNNDCVLVSTMISAVPFGSPILRNLASEVLPTIVFHSQMSKSAICRESQSRAAAPRTVPHTRGRAPAASVPAE